jgi:ABC-2 type transport system permease protein
MTRQIRTELLKQRTTRTSLAGIAAAPIVAALVTVAVYGAAGKQGNAPLGPDSLVQALGAPASVITLIAVLLGVVGAAGEWRHQTITTTFLATPRRRDVVVAKLLAHLATGAMMGVLSLAASAGIAVPWLRSERVAVVVDGEVLSISAGVVLLTALYGALGVAVGALVRNLTAAAAVVLVWLLAVEGLVSEVFHRSEFVHWLPAAAGRALVGAADRSHGLSGPVAAAVFTAYVGVLAVLAARLTLSRDIG